MLKILVLVFLSFATLASVERSDYEQLKDTVKLLYQGSYTQITTETNLYYILPGVATTYYAFEHDKRLSDLERAKPLRKHYDITGDMGIVFNFPLVPIGMYYMGKSKNNNHLIQFAKEYMAAMYLTLIETGVISYIPGHERPNKEGQSKWETEFRGNNSFPSGHIVPYSALFFKTFQFYGPYWAIVPGVLTYWSSLQRIREGRHYVSDVVGAFWLTAMASEGVRKAAGYPNNNKLYKKIFERGFRLSMVMYQGVVGPGITYIY